MLFWKWFRKGDGIDDDCDVYRFNPCCSGSGSGSSIVMPFLRQLYKVSILVVLEVVPEDDFHRRLRLAIAVSILVVLEVVPEALVDME